MRSSSICCATIRALAAALALACLACASGGGAGGSLGAMADLTNPFLGPEYSAWLIGPVARIASRDEIKAYLALHDDREADAFIQQFWERRGQVASAGGFPSRSARAVFEERAAVADKKYSEAGLLGHRTDRGTIFVLYGLPSRGGFEVAQRPTDPPIEVWQYDAGAPAGLDGKQPDPVYRFAKRGDLTVFYHPRPGSRLTPALPPPP